jgi:hypothetical protein
MKPNNRTKALWGVLFCLLTIIAYAQPSQQIRGTVVDAILQIPVSGATISLNNNRSVQTNEQGVFKFPDVPVGSYQVHVTHISFKQASLQNINVNAGKETVLTIPMEGAIRLESEVVIKANSRKNKPLNEMSTVSARAFTVEETQKYAASVNDPLRMATGFAGVVSADDGNNNIVIRGNAPTGLLWRMEGVDIPNPNHFGGPGGSCG